MFTYSKMGRSLLAGMLDEFNVERSDMEIKVSEIVDYGISADGRDTVVNFQTTEGYIASLHFSSLDMEKIVHELALVVSRAKELSEPSKQNIPAILKPSKALANLAAGEMVIVLSLQIPNNLEIHYGFEVKQALTLATQIISAADGCMEDTRHSGH